MATPKTARPTTTIAEKPPARTAICYHDIINTEFVKFCLIKYFVLDREYFKNSINPHPLKVCSYKT
jgi:hypothetical protein